MLEEANKLLAKIARQFLEAVNAEVEEWDVAYLRVQVGKGHKAYEASTLSEGRGSLFENLRILNDAAETTVQLAEELEREGHPFLLMMMTLSRSGSFEVDFERRNRKRWEISVGGGHNGVPGDQPPRL